MSRGFRSLADQIRAWPDDRLSRLLLARPDLATPAPHDSAQLAARAATRSSLVRALDQLDRCELCVLDALVARGQTTSSEVSSIIHADPSSVETALARLEELALAWHSVGGLRALTGVGDALGGSTLQPFSPDAPSPQTVTALLDEISPQARAMLDHVAAHGGEATIGRARTTVLPADAETPAEELLSRRLLVPRGNGTCVVPGEVGLALRGGRTTDEPVDLVPQLATSSREHGIVERAAAGAAFDAVRRTELLLDGWGTAPPPALRSGGLGVRELKATALRLQVDEPTAALLVEVAVAAGLATTAAGPDGNPVWMPTDLADSWAEGSPAARWSSLARTWLTMPQLPGLVGARDVQDRLLNALMPELVSPHVAETRLMTLAALASLPDGQVLAPGTGGATLVARLAWLRPRRPRSRTDEVGWALSEAATLGLIGPYQSGLGGLASYARELIDGADPAPLLEALLPEPVDHVLLQADLTAVAPGPLESSLARTLGLVADVESRGGATVYRFTAGSVRRAMDVGWTAVELHDFVSSVSRTPVPQPLTYLIDDTARTFGSIRVGNARAFLRADDEHVLTELLHRAPEGLGLRRIAPTVLIATTPLDVLLPRLRDLGAAPVVEAADGTVRVARPEALRARTPKDRPGLRSTAREAARETARVAAVISAVRAGDEIAASRPVEAPPERQSPATAVSMLREAIDAGAPVTIGYVDNQGLASERRVTPVAVDSGQLTAHDERADDLRLFALSRISSVRLGERSAGD